MCNLCFIAKYGHLIKENTDFSTGNEEKRRPARNDNYDYKKINLT